MGEIRARGIVIRRRDYGDNNALLSILTPDLGIVKAVIYGVKGGRNKSKAAAGEFLCYAEYSLFAGKGDMLTVNNAEIADAFLPIAQSLSKLSLCSYMADILWYVLGENNADERLFSLFMNCVYALAYRDDDIEKVKTVFEWKLMSAGGYMPVTDCCVKCGSVEDLCAFNAREGGMMCRSCISDGSSSMSKEGVMALRYIVNCPDKRMLAFRSKEVLVKELSKLSELYVRYRTGNKFASLDYYKAMRDM